MTENTSNIQARSIFRLGLCRCIVTDEHIFFFTVEKGIKLVQEGQYSQAARMFTEAIKCDPNDYRCVPSSVLVFIPFFLECLLLNIHLSLTLKWRACWKCMLCFKLMLLQVLRESVLLLLLLGAVLSGLGRRRALHPASSGMAQRTLPQGQCSHGHAGGLSRHTRVTWLLGFSRKNNQLTTACECVLALQWGGEGHGAGAQTGQRLWRGCEWTLQLQSAAIDGGYLWKLLLFFFFNDEIVGKHATWLCFRSLDLKKWSARRFWRNSRRCKLFWHLISMLLEVSSRSCHIAKNHFWTSSIYQAFVSLLCSYKPRSVTCTTRVTWYLFMRL